jgi:hypothetical protein
LEAIQVNLNIKYLNNLINGCSKSNIECDNIKKLLNKLDNEVQDIQNCSITEHKIKIACDMTEKGITETETIDYLYLKPWSKLTQIHKVIKIKEFINNLEINEHDKEELKEHLIEMSKDKKKKNKINYDEVKCKIINVSSLVFTDGKYKLEE